MNQVILDRQTYMGLVWAVNALIQTHEQPGFRNAGLTVVAAKDILKHALNVKVA